MAATAGAGGVEHADGSSRQTALAIPEEGEDGMVLGEAEAAEAGVAAAREHSATLQYELEWRDIEFGVMEKDKDAEVAHCWTQRPMRYKSILSGICGTARSGQLLAIMGASGSGKTSLLNILAGRVQENDAVRFSGSVMVNGEQRSANFFKSDTVAYVQQDDILFAHLTVLETLQLAATFKLPGSLTSQERAALVDAVVGELGLAKVRHTIIGNEFKRGVSGGERKRVNIGVELLTDPRILFLDEPTSGLDSFQAQSVMTALNDMANQRQRLVVAVIHQPRSSIFNMFDQLLLLSAGKLMYMGPATEAVGYFRQQGHPCPSLFNPADFFLDLLSVDYRTKELEQQTEARVEELGTAWASTAAVVRQQRSAPQRSVSMRQRLSDTETEGGILAACRDMCGPGYQTSLWRQYLVLTWRSWTDMMRNSFGLAIRVVTTIFFALIVAALYSDLDRSQDSIQDRVGLCFLIAIQQLFGPFNGVLNSLPVEKKVVDKERASHSYSTWTYFLARFTSETPLICLTTTLYSVIIYWTAGLNPDAGRFGEHILAVNLEALTAAAYGMVVSAFAATPQIASALGVPVAVVSIFFGGFYVKSSNVPIGARWLLWLSPIRWSFKALVIAEFAGETFHCDDDVDDADASPCFENGAQVLEQYSYDDKASSKWNAILGLVGTFLIGNFLAALILEYRRPRFMNEETAEPPPENAMAAADAAAAGDVQLQSVPKTKQVDSKAGDTNDSGQPSGTF